MRSRSWSSGDLLKKSATAELVLFGSSISNRAPFTFEIVEVGGAVLLSETFSGQTVQDAPSFTALWSISNTFTTASITDLVVRLRWTNSTGGGAGADFALTQLTITAQ